MSDHVSGSKPPDPVVVKNEEGWTSVSASARDTSGDEPVKLADEKPADEGEEAKAEGEKPKAEEKPKTEEKVDAKAEEKAEEETDEQKQSKRKERSKDRVARIRGEIAAATKAKHEAAGTSTARTEVKAEEKTAAKADAEKPKKPVWADFEAAGKTFEEFQDARDEFVRAELRAELKADAEKTAEDKIKADREERAAQERQQQYRERLEATKAKLPDFDAVIAEGLKDVPAAPFFDAMVKRHSHGPEIAYALAKDPDLAFEVSNMEPPRFVFDLIRATESAEMAVAVLAHLTDNPAVYEDICRSHPIQAAKKISRIEAGFERAHDGSRSARGISKASPPTRPIGGTRSAATSRGPASADSEDILDYIKRENRNEARRHGVR